MFYPHVSKFEYNIIPIFIDEVYFSWFARLHSTSGNYGYKFTVKELLGLCTSKTNNNIYHPVNLDYLCSKLPSEWNLSSESFIQNHTVFPFFKPFLAYDKSNLILAAMKAKGKESLSFKKMMGVNSGNIFNDNTIKICPDCLNEDSIHDIDCYVRRNHQVPGNLVCTKHRKFLIQKNISKAEMFSSIFNNDNYLSNMLNSGVSREVFSEEFINLSNDIESIMQGVLNYHDLSDIKNKCITKLQLLGYKKKGNTIAQSALLSDFLSFYSKEFLCQMNSHIDTPVNSWFELITTNRKEMVHPIRYLLFIRFLFGSINEFADFSEKYEPFGKGPFPCFNPASDHYKAPTIDSYKVIYNSTSKKYSGRFTCKCGFAYSIVISNEIKEDIFSKRRIVSYGSIWESKLKELILSNRYSLKQIQEIMTCKVTAIISTAKSLGIAHLLKTQNSAIKKDSYFDVRKARLDQHKLNVLNYLKQSKNAKRTDIINACRTSYYALLQKDKAWLEKNIPPIRRANNFSSQKDWHSIDNQYKDVAIKAINELLMIEPPVIISMSKIALHTDKSILERKKALVKMPLTYEIIQKAVETKKDYLKRNITYVIKRELESGKDISVEKVNSTIRMRPEECKEFEEYIINTISIYKRV